MLQGVVCKVSTSVITIGVYQVARCGRQSVYLSIKKLAILYIK